MPESISSKKVAYTKYLPAQVANTIATDPYWSDMMKTCISTFQNEVTTENVDYINSCITECGNIITTNLMGLEDTKEKREKSNINAKDVEDIAKAVVTKEITRNLSKIALQEMNKTGKPLSEVISEQDLGNVSDEADLAKFIDEVIKEESEAVNQIRKNPETVNFLVGKVMQKTKGKADPSITLQLLKSKLGI